MSIGMGILLLIGISALYFQQKSSNNQPLWPDYTIEERMIEGKNYKLIKAQTPQQWEKGLMFVRGKQNEYDGMIFSFPKKEQRTFWNKNTFVDLHIYWMDGEAVVGKDVLPSIVSSGTIVTVASPQPVNGVIELF